jgi:hypothetical protein
MLRPISNQRSIALLIIISAAIRLPFLIIPPRDGLYNVDELSLALTTLDRWLGLPSMSLAWPAAPSQMLITLILAPQFLLTLAHDRTLGQYAIHLFALYENPSVIIVTLRSLSCVAAIVSAVSLFRILRDLSSDCGIALPLAVLWTSLSLFTQLSLTGTSDALSVMFCCLTTMWLFGQPARPLLAGLAAAAAISSKVTIALWMGPLIIAALFALGVATSAPQFARLAARFAGAALGGLLFFLPFVWTDPLRSLKAIMGNVVAHTGSHIPNLKIAFLPILPGHLVLLGLLSLALVAAWMIRDSREQRYRIIALALLMTATTLLLMRGFTYWRYACGAIVPAGILSAVSVRALPRVFARAALCILALAVSFDALANQWQMRRGVGLRDLIQDVEERCNENQRLWLDSYVLAARFDTLPITRSVATGLATEYAATAALDHLRPRLAASGMDPVAISALQTAFNEHEQAQLARWRGLSLFGRLPLRCEMHIFDVAQHVELNGTGATGRVKANSSQIDLTKVVPSAERGNGIVVLGSAADLAEAGFTTLKSTTDGSWAIGSP